MIRVASSHSRLASGSSSGSSCSAKRRVAGSGAASRLLGECGPGWPVSVWRGGSSPVVVGVVGGGSPAGS
ncbi:hypothetical protein ABZZ74_44105, partial [Streptomyces sp. NPDC006476]|uniref:hypothetical protein n=1 Tax=Streptomyces sp. NPDC006476 TaxID=3157175 RepID=UPI0033A20F6A